MKPHITKKSTNNKFISKPKSLYVHYIQCGIPSLKERLRNLDPKLDTDGLAQREISYKQRKPDLITQPFRTAATLKINVNNQNSNSLIKSLL